MIELYRSKGIVLPEFKAEDRALISQKLDFIELNYYNDFYVRADEQRWPLGFTIENPKNVPVTDREWPITEDGFTRMLLRLTREYGVPKILVTENGASYPDVVDLNGMVEDGARCDFLRRPDVYKRQAAHSGCWRPLNVNLERSMPSNVWSRCWGL